MIYENQWYGCVQTFVHQLNSMNKNSSVWVYSLWERIYELFENLDLHHGYNWVKNKDMKSGMKLKIMNRCYIRYIEVMEFDLW